MLPLPAALSIAVLISAVACLQKVWTTNATVGMIANTTSGLIKGHANAQYPYVSEYLGVPFAHPPLNNLRFMPPKAYAGCGKEVVADEQPPSCPQQRIAANYSQPLDFINHALADGTFANHTSEDCLYLNVWTKFPCVGAPLKPVLVWINGGGFHSGGVGDDSEQGAIFAEQQDVVLVSFNYRLGIFGFPGSPSTRQNLALLDQRVAVEWIQKNIMSFGGDAEKITIFGHSAGGASVDYYNYAWADDPIVAGSVIMSGNAFSFGNRYPNTSAEAWYTASTVLRCGNQTRSTDADIFSCMRTKSVAELLNATDVAGKYLGTKLDPLAARFLNTIGPFGPTIDNVTVFQNYTARGKEKDFIKRPILAGTNDDEGCLFAERGDIPVSAEDEFTTVVFTCPTYHAVQSRVDAGVPSWKYRFFAAYPNTHADACPGRPWHGSELLLLFGSSVRTSAIPATHEETEMGWYLRQAWSAFAHDPAHGLTDVLGWPTSESDSKALMVLGLNSTLAVSRDATSWDLPCITTLGTPIDIKAIITADIVSIWHDEHLSTRSDREGSKRAVSVRKGESSELFMKDSAES